MARGRVIPTAPVAQPATTKVGATKVPPSLEESLGRIPLVHEMLEQEALEDIDIAGVDRRLTLLSRLLIESGLRDVTIDKARKVDLALRTIAQLEGSKSTLWLQDARKASMSEQDVYKAKEAVEARLRTLMAEVSKGDKGGAAEIALATLEATSEPSN